MPAIMAGAPAVRVTAVVSPEVASVKAPAALAAPRTKPEMVTTLTVPRVIAPAERVNTISVETVVESAPEVRTDAVADPAIPCWPAAQVALPMK